MKEEIAKRWVAALRSGEYKQGKGWLRRVSSEGASEYCCLGVLCDISKIQRWETSDSVFSYGEERPGIVATNMLPKKVVSYAGMNSYDGEREGFERELWNLNDGIGGRRYSFQEIADIIEKEWESL